MEKAFDCALVLKTKHELLVQQIAESNSSSIQKELRKKQNAIALQIMQFLEDIQEFKSIFMLNQKLKMNYIILVQYFSKQIHTRIYQIQMQLDFLAFEAKFSFNEEEPNNCISHSSNIENIQEKLNTYYQFFKS